LEELVAIFIDGSNFYRVLEANKGRHDLDFQKFALKLVGSRRLLRTYFYTAAVDQFKGLERYKEQQKFFYSLHRTPYLELRLGRLVTHGNEEVEKGVDVRLAIDMLKLAWARAYDTAVLVSHDGDFADAVLAVKEMGKHVECAGFMNQNTPNKIADRLIQVADRVIALDGNFLDECWLK
jgi:uncharacterized LabA/DUF88 family protein